MTACIFEIDETRRLVPCPPERAATEGGIEGKKLWIDLTDPDPAELADWLDRIGVGDLTRRLCVEARHRPGFLPLTDEIYLVIPVLIESPDSGEVDHVAMLARENVLLTVHRKSIVGSGELASLEQSQSWLSEASIPGLVSALMIQLSLDFLRHATDLRSSILALEERMDREPDTVEAEEILGLRAGLIALGGVVGDQLPAIRSLSATDRPFFRLDAARDSLNCALVNLDTVDRSLDWLDSRMAALRAGFEMYAQDQTNRRLNLLTILSAVFNPATLLAGIWGMNFVSMPELQFPYAYPIALGVMILIGVLMYRFFRQGGWLD